MYEAAGFCALRVTEGRGHGNLHVETAALTEIEI